MSKGRPKKYDHDQALESAMGVFWQKGFEGASCEDLMEAMQVNAGSMYAAFGDKSSLFEKAFDLYEKTIFSEVLNTLNSEESPLKSVRSLVCRWADFMLHPSRRGCLVTSTVIDFRGNRGGVAGRARRLLAKVQKNFEKKLIEAQSQGELAKDANPKQLAAFLVNTAQGLTVMTRAGASKETINGVVATALSLLR